jgi:hypothetical protein
MKQHLSAAIALITVTVSLQSVASASGWSRGLTVTSLEEALTRRRRAAAQAHR